MEIGPSSGREFDPGKAGGPLRKLSSNKIKITEEGVQTVEAHLSRFGPYVPNQIMIGRLRRIAAGELKATVYDRKFYAHELREYVRYVRPGWRTGAPAGEDARHQVWNNAHTASLEEYGIRKEILELYHPDAKEFLE